MLEQWYKDAVARGWCDTTFEEYKRNVRFRVCCMLGRMVSYEDLEDTIVLLQKGEL